MAAKRGNIEVMHALIKYVVLYNHKAAKSDYIDNNNTKLSQYWDDCQNEVRKMQNEKIGNSNISLCKFLSETDKNKLASYLSNKFTGMRETLKEGQYLKSYPIYASMIENQYKKGVETRKLLIGCEMVLRESTPGRYLLVDTIHLLAKEMVRSKVMNVDVESFMRSKGREMA